MSKAIWAPVFNSIKHGGLIVRYWDGQEATYGPEPAPVKIIFNTEPSALKLIEDPVLALGEAYMDGQVDFEGDFDALIGLLSANFRHRLTGFGLVCQGLSGLVKGLAGQKENIQAHYDLGNDFFSLWLDESFIYSCAYFRRGDEDLRTAQQRKVELVLKKLRLTPGMRILDIGCGWGALIQMAVERYGVTAVGLTLSEEQLAGARDRLRAAGLGGAAEVRLQNYLELDPAEGLFDRVLSVGMFEHVGRANLGRYFDRVGELLKPGGLSLLHTLTSLDEAETNSWVKKYIFPGGYIPSLRETVALLPERDFRLLHLESLRRHYVRTLEIWLENFMKPEVYDTVQVRFGRRFMRMWTLYLRGAASSLRGGALDIHQILFSKGVNNDLPLTFDYIYE